MPYALDAALEHCRKRININDIGVIREFAADLA